MKGRDMFCASQASTAICMSNIIMDQPSSSCSSAYNPGSTPFIDRHNPIIRDERRNVPFKPPCSFQTPISPKPHNVLNKNHNSSAKDRDYLVLNKKPKKQIDQKKKQSSFVKDTQNLSVKKSSVIKAGDLITPPGSTRYLLGDSEFFKMLSDHDPVEPQKNQDPVDPMKNYVSVEPKKNQFVKTTETSFSAKNSLSSFKPSSILSQRQDQVVVLRVSLHCKGCEGKVRKHISRMAGVTSFNIDFAAKKVTVVGDVTPLSVLASISKVKNAQLLNPLSVASSHIPANK